MLKFYDLKKNNLTLNDTVEKYKKSLEIKEEEIRKLKDEIEKVYYQINRI